MGVITLAEKNYCAKCGKALEKDANFCSNCGYKIQRENNDDQRKEEEEDLSYENVVNNESREYRKQKETKLPKIWGHVLIGVISLVLTFIGVAFFEEITRSAFGYYTPAIVEVISTIVIGFIIAGILVLVISVYAVKLNLLIYEKDKITWSDILLKKVKFSEKIFSFIFSYFLVMLINLVVMGATIFSIYLAAENYNYELVTFLQIAGGIVLLLINSRLILSQFIVFDQRERAFASLKKSVKLTKGNTFKVVGWIILIAIINSIGGAFIFGVFVSLPLSMYILTKVYYDLKTPQKS